MKPITYPLLLLAFLAMSCHRSQSISNTKAHPTSTGTPVELTSQNFDKLVGDKKGVVVMYFWASWCGPCRMTAPVVEEVAKSQKGKAGIGKVNVDKNPELTKKYQVRSIPTFLFLKDGEVVGKHVGVTTQQNLEAQIEKFRGA